MNIPQSTINSVLLILFCISFGSIFGYASIDATVGLGIVLVATIWG